MKFDNLATVPSPAVLAALTDDELAEKIRENVSTTQTASDAFYQARLKNDLNARDKWGKLIMLLGDHLTPMLKERTKRGSAVTS
jgi:hypothetical protein